MKHYQHTVNLEEGHIIFHQAKQWCRKEWGPSGSINKVQKWAISIEWKASTDTIVVFVFHNKEDAVLFKMTWG